MTFDALISEALNHKISGWDFSYIEERSLMEDISWNYREIVSSRFKPDITLMDMGTGGGELLSSFSGLPENTFATEGYPPNISVARKRLESLGI